MLKEKIKKDIQRKYYLCDLSQADKHLQEQRALEKTDYLAERTEHQGMDMQFAVRLFSYFECESEFHSQQWKTKHKEKPFT